MSQETPAPAPREYTLDQFLWSNEERAGRWQAYQGSHRVITLTDADGNQRNIHVNPSTEDRAAYHAFTEQHDEIAKLPLYLTEDGPNLGDHGIRAGVMGAIRHPGRTCFVYLDEAGAPRFVLVPYAEEMAAWRQVLDGEWTALEGYDVLDVTPALSQWAVRGSG